MFRETTCHIRVDFIDAGPCSGSELIGLPSAMMPPSGQPEASASNPQIPALPDQEAVFADFFLSHKPRLVCHLETLTKK